jgi:polyisoprenoid-binding protein YceI
LLQHIKLKHIIHQTFKHINTMATTKWTIDPAHSEIQFKVKHLMVTTVTGSFKKFEGGAETESDDFNDAKISFSADIASIDTGSSDRDNHLKTADFFELEKHPKLQFTSTSFKKKSDEDYELNGDLTIRGITKPVKLKVVYAGQAKDPWGNTKAGFELEGKINRKDWGLTWNAPLEAGGVLVSDEVRLLAEIQLVKS